jgi:hypothetical protein
MSHPDHYILSGARGGNMGLGVDYP